MTDLDLQVLRGRILDEDTGQLRDHCDETGECLEDTAALIAEVERLRGLTTTLDGINGDLLRESEALQHVVEAAWALVEKSELGEKDRWFVDDNEMNALEEALGALKESHD